MLFYTTHYSCTGKVFYVCYVLQSMGPTGMRDKLSSAVDITYSKLLQLVEHIKCKWNIQTCPSGTLRVVCTCTLTGCIPAYAYNYAFTIFLQV